jgi:hypothetical protein
VRKTLIFKTEVVMDLTRIYDLSFMGPGRRPRTPPAIVFSIDARHLTETSERLNTITSKLSPYAQKYFGAMTKDFSLPIHDLFGYCEFGYGNCGYVTSEPGRIHFRIELRPHPTTAYAALTIFVLTKALGFPLTSGAQSNHAQAVDS